MNERPMRILDLFCGAGGASMGYHRYWPDAEIVGIDINPQPNYPFKFIQADLRDSDPVDGATFDLIHASPPCQAHSTLRHSPGGKDYENLIPTTYAFLEEGASGIHVIENVPGAPLRDPNLKLCGSMFDDELHTDDGHVLRRHRIFDVIGHPLPQPPCRHGKRPVLGVYGDIAKNPRPSTRGVKAGFEQAKRLMGIDWMTRKEIVQAIPPAYTEFIAFWLDELGCTYGDCPHE